MRKQVLSQFPFQSLQPWPSIRVWPPGCRKTGQEPASRRRPARPWRLEAFSYHFSLLLEARSLAGLRFHSWCRSGVIARTGEIDTRFRGTTKIQFRKLNSILINGSAAASRRLDRIQLLAGLTALHLLRTLLGSRRANTCGDGVATLCASPSAASSRIVSHVTSSSHHK